MWFRVVATAITYMRRVYTRKSLTEYEPRLIAPTCLYLASKAEESVVHAKLLGFYIRKLCNLRSYYFLDRVFLNNFLYLLLFERRNVDDLLLIHSTDADDKYRYEIKYILEMEMKMLEALNFYLVVFHPYRSLPELLQDAGINDTSMTHLSCLCSKSLWTLLKWLSARTISSRRVTLNTDHNHNHRHRLALGLVNDTYRMDLILVHPPYLIALACVYIASVYKEKDIRSWLEELCVDMNVVKNIAMEILDFYENHRTITEERVHSAFSKLGKKP
ncbi:PREDICTED: cyclin-C1-2-like isoform X5 [Tarenaya hassleriana]|uniref:cyclin-C1-2-like isoform X5 n=1 Tax=Tarenaya hassleriana TaxID=28532 RepID=UPI00053C7991|nr:PREDICTED: cyclin-C1-2-like isoform X5 [Tarenaya hassleriana]XP_010547120.1 PREDICTED: cyclin-C1-2-like isoform X5 [Tarenaya hassleriana]